MCETTSDALSGLFAKYSDEIANLRRKLYRRRVLPNLDTPVEQFKGIEMEVASPKDKNRLGMLWHLQVNLLPKVCHWLQEGRVEVPKKRTSAFASSIYQGD